MLRQGLATLAQSTRLRHMVATMPVSSAIVARFVAGETVTEALEVSRGLVADGRYVSLSHLGEDTTDRHRAEVNKRSYITMLERLGRAGLTRGVEMSVKLSAIGAALGRDGGQLARDNAASICSAARAVNTTVTFDMEDHTTLDPTLWILREVGSDFPETGVVLQAYLYRTEADCDDLARAGFRVRLCKGAYREPVSVAYQQANEVDRAYVRCLKILLAGAGYPMVATHDPRLVEIAGALAARYGRGQGSYEYQMLYGVRPVEQQRLASRGEKLRVYVPYGSQWYPYLMRRLAERPANVGFFLRSLATKS